MATQGPFFPTTGVDDTTVGTQVWTFPTRISAEDASDASISAANGSNLTTHYLKGTNFGFSIPAGATINGILVEWKRAYTGTLIEKDSSIKIVKGGVIGGTDQSAAAAWASASVLTWASFGGASNLWGLTWTDTDINATTFGAVLSGVCTTGDAAMTPLVDACRITVTYTASGGAADPYPLLLPGPTRVRYINY